MADKDNTADRPTSPLDARLDAALADSFPASDPVAISIDHAQSLIKPKPEPAAHAVKE